MTSKLGVNSGKQNLRKYNKKVYTLLCVAQVVKEVKDTILKILEKFNGTHATEYSSEKCSCSEKTYSERPNF